MKNIVPLILAVVLGLAAVFGVKHAMSGNVFREDRMIDVVASAQEMPLNTLVTQPQLIKKTIPVKAMPAKAIPWSEYQVILGQKTLRMIPNGDYVQWSDIGSSGGVSDLIGVGEWAIAVSFADSVIASALRPGDEVAIIGTLNVPYKEDEESFTVGKESGTKESRKNVTMTIIPRARIVSVPGGVGSTIIMTLNPEQAQFLLDAQRKMSLYPALRRPHDDTYTNRLKTGMVDDETYDKLFNGQHRIILPDEPDADMR